MVYCLNYGTCLNNMKFSYTFNSGCSIGRKRPANQRPTTLFSFHAAAAHHYHDGRSAPVLSLSRLRCTVDVKWVSDEESELKELSPVYLGISSANGRPSHLWLSLIESISSLICTIDYLCIVAAIIFYRLWVPRCCAADPSGCYIFLVTVVNDDIPFATQRTTINLRRSNGGDYDTNRHTTTA